MKRFDRNILIFGCIIYILYALPNFGGLLMTDIFLEYYSLRQGLLQFMLWFTLGPFFLICLLLVVYRLIRMKKELKYDKQKKQVYHLIWIPIILFVPSIIFPYFLSGFSLKLAPFAWWGSLVMDTNWLAILLLFTFLARESCPKIGKYLESIYAKLFLLLFCISFPLMIQCIGGLNLGFFLKNRLERSLNIQGASIENVKFQDTDDQLIAHFQVKLPSTPNIDQKVALTDDYRLEGSFEFNPYKEYVQYIAKSQEGQKFLDTYQKAVQKAIDESGTHFEIVQNQEEVKDLNRDLIPTTYPHFTYPEYPSDDLQEMAENSKNSAFAGYAAYSFKAYMRNVLRPQLVLKGGDEEEMDRLVETIDWSNLPDATYILGNRIYTVQSGKLIVGYHSYRTYTVQDWEEEYQDIVKGEGSSIIGIDLLLLCLAQPQEKI